MTIWLPYWTMLRTELRRLVSIWYETLLPPALSAGLYLLVFGGLVGDAIGDIQGHSYEAFIIPGIILMSVITGAYQHVAFSVYHAKFEHYIEELLVSPIPNLVMVAGYASGGILRGTVIALGVAAVSSLFFVPVIHDWLVLLVILLLTTSLFAVTGFINGLYANSWDDVSNMLPEWGQWISQVNPVFYMISGFRFGFLGSSDVSPLLSIAMLLLFNVGFWGYALYLLRKGIGVRH